MSTPPTSLSSLRIAALLGDLDFNARPPQVLRGDGVSYIPAFDAGTTELRTDDALAGLSFVALSGDVGTEDLLMRDAPILGHARYPDQAPRTPSSGAAEVQATGAAQGFASRAAFQTGAWAALSLGASEGASYARARIQRFQVTNPSALAGSLVERTPESRKITRLVGQDAQGASLEGWVYVETAIIVGTSIVERQIHQIVPAGMRLAPTGGVTLNTFNNPSAWDLAGLIAAKAGVGWQYVRCVCWVSLVHSAAEMQAAGLPGAPAVPGGVTGWV